MKELAKSFSEILNHWGEGRVKLDEARRYAGNIAEKFGLKPEPQKEFIEQVGKNLLRYISIHSDVNAKLFSIEQQENHIEIADGDVRLAKYLKKSKAA